MKRVALAASAAVALTIAACSSDAAPSPDGAAPSTAMSPLSEPTLDPSAEVTTLDTAAAPSTGAPAVAADVADGVQPAGFTTALVEITTVDGEVCQVCMWLADTAGERAQGLMGVTLLGTPRGMAFVWDEPTAGSFYMFQTVTPLSIAWFGAAGGALVSTTDMEPCLDETSAGCERFASGGEYVLAVEVFQGDLASIGITEGATARLLADTEAADCPLT